MILPGVRSLLSSTCLLVAAAAAYGSNPSAEAISPPPPKEYRVILRYQLRGPRVERLRQFAAMKSYLQSLGFQKDASEENEAEDPRITRITGTIGSANARKMLGDEHVRSILLAPSDFSPPAEAQQPVKVQLELMGGRELDRQRLLADQLKEVLKNGGFQEAIAYDNRGHTRIVGTIRAGLVPRLLDDLRLQSSGWPTPDKPRTELPAPLGTSVWPLTTIEVIPEPAGIPPVKALAQLPAVPAGQEFYAKITPDLRAMLGKDEAVRIEVVLARTPDETSRFWREELQRTAPGAMIEGRLGPLVSLLARTTQVARLAQLPGVVNVRLPRVALSQVLAQPVTGWPTNYLYSSNVDRLHNLPHGGQGLRLVVLDSDFRGYKKFVTGKVQFIDLSAECRPNIDPVSTDGSEPGTGTLTAAALTQFAPAAEFNLVRVDPTQPYQIQLAAQYISGEVFLSDCMTQRAAELSADSDRLEKRRAELLTERTVVLENFSQDKATTDRRAAYFKNQAAFEADELALQAREKRYLGLLKSLRSLKGVRLVACDLIWSDGYPVDGSNALSRYFNDRPFKAALWFQANGIGQGQAWSGLFRDADGNEVMEFAPPGTPIKAGRWSSEVNFFGWKPYQGANSVDLPKGKYRITMQWREAHDPALYYSDTDVYRQSLAKLNIVVLRQRDPSGTKLATDDMETTARSTGSPHRLDYLPNSATYEQSVEFTVDERGRYALRIEGKAPTGIRPSIVQTLPLNRETWELRLRLLANLDDPSKQAGRPFFLDYATDEGSAGMPSDAVGIIRVEPALK